MKFLRFFIFAFIFSGLCLSKTNVFGPEKYIRETGKPQKVVKNFYVSNPSSEFELYVQNGDGKKEKSSSALIEINGEVIVEPKEFNKNVDIIVKEISLKNQNEIAVEVRSEPGSYIIVSIFGPDAPPSNLIESIKVEPQEIFMDGNRKAIVLSPFKFDFRAGQDESEKIKDTMETSHCSRFDVDYLINDQVTVEVIKGLYKYGIISIKTHGDSYFKFLNYEKWGWNFFWGQVAFSTGEQVTHENELIYEQDLKMGRLAIHKITNDRGADLGEHYLILPSFIKYYAAERYPNSLVYLSSCMSAYNYSLFHEFRNAGVKVFLGYSHDVHPSFSYDAGSTFFSNYFEWNFWSARYAFDAVPNRVDPNNSLCHFPIMAYGLETL